MIPTENYAVSGKRHDRKDKTDDFPTPSWATRALVEEVLHKINVPTNQMTVWEPAANRGFMVRPLEEYFGSVLATDKYDYGLYPTLDFLSVSPHEAPPVEFIITNPPFSQAEEFIEKSLKIATVGVCMLTRTSFLESNGRYDRLFSTRPPTLICQFAERVPMIKERVSKTASTATSYCWLVWDAQNAPNNSVFSWIPPCRKRLEREGDYDLPVELAFDNKELMFVRTEAGI